MNMVIKNKALAVLMNPEQLFNCSKLYIFEETIEGCCD